MMTEIIVLTRAQYQSDLKEAARIAVREVLSEIKYSPDKPDELLTTKEAMELKGYKVHRSFKNWLRKNNIIPFRRDKNTKLYKKSDLLKPTKFI